MAAGPYILLKSFLKCFLISEIVAIFVARVREVYQLAGVRNIRPICLLFLERVLIALAIIKHDALLNSSTVLRVSYDEDDGRWTMSLSYPARGATPTTAYPALGKIYAGAICSAAALKIAKGSLCGSIPMVSRSLTSWS